MPVVVFLRGMNVGRRRITNEELVAVLTDAGHREVSAYQASGNLILGADESDDADDISRLLETALGYEVPVFVRTVEQLRLIASGSPIEGRVGVDGGKPQIVFLSTAKDVDACSVFPDGHEVHHVGSELHWLPPVGLSQLGDLPRRIDQAFGPTTTRTLGTIQRLANRLG